MDSFGIDIYHILRPFVQPAIGAIHGWFATKMVVIMLFRPHNTYHFPITGKQIPFTPGIFPSRKKDLARNISTTVTETLLTTEDIKIKADKFITEENIFLIVNVVIDTMLDGLKYTDKIQKISEQFRESIPEMISNGIDTLINRLMDNHNHQRTRLADYIIEEFLLNFKINHDEAHELVNYIFRNFFSADKIRVTLEDALSPEKAVNLQIVLRDKTTGTLKFILSIVNLEGIFNNFREYLRNEPEKSEALINDIILQLKVKEDLTEKVANLDFKKLSFEDISSLKITLSKTIENYLREHKYNIEQHLEHINKVIIEIVNQKIISFTPSQIKPEIIMMIKKEISKFLHNYLKSELTNLINNAIDAIKPKEMIASKIEAYSSRDIENLILSIMKKELKNLEFLGFIIGLLLGIMALGVEFFLPLR